MNRTNDLIIAVGALTWVVAAIFYGAYINPFEWWLAFLEAIEFIPYLLAGGSITSFVAAFPNPETTAIVAGWIGIIGWVSLSVAFYRERARVPLSLNLLFVPLLSLVAVGLWYRANRRLGTGGQEQVSAE